MANFSANFWQIVKKANVKNLANVKKFDKFTTKFGKTKLVKFREGQLTTHGYVHHKA